MEWSALSRAGVPGLALAALGCSGDPRPPGLTTDPIDAAFDDAPVSVGVVRGVIPGRGGPPSGTPPSLTCRRASAILVIDRSGSMRGDTLDGVEKWGALLAALDTALPRIERDVALGLVTFPQPGSRGGAGAPDSVCALRTTLDLEPQLNAASAILSRLRATPPEGATPTAGAVEVAGRWFADHPDRDGERYVVLATDGAPNCNPSLDPSSCICTGAASSCNPSVNPSAPINCLDDDRTLAAIGLVRRQGVLTYVMGLNGAEAFSGVLDAMANAGGRARAATPRFYPANSATDLARELSSITSSIVNCR